MEIVLSIAFVAVLVCLYRRRKEKEEEPDMQGLQAFNENGDIVFDLSHSTARFIGSDQLAASYPYGQSKTISVTKNTSSEKIFFYLQLVSGDLNFNLGFNGGNAWAVADDVNNTITFTVYWGTYKIYYGVYVP